MIKEIRTGFAYKRLGWGLTTKWRHEGTFLGDGNDFYFERMIVKPLPNFIGLDT